MGFEAIRGRMNVAMNLVCSTIVFLFLITSAPISQFRGKGIKTAADGTVSGASKMSCLTVWGLKNDCSINDYHFRPASMTCARGKQLFQASEAFYIISVIVSLVSSIMGGLYFMGIRMKVLLMVLAVAEVVFALIPWACMTGVWYASFCNSSEVTVDRTIGKPDGIPYGKLLRQDFETSAGYGLTIAAWCIQLAGMIFLFVL
ncbi:putative surface protein amastin [Leptomonas pyrrhocoris]|uniref:Putative surface protein amastin n=1 Tax=Leptomonas pyrrhocoris TaxID=157538 RepID=A0A0N0DXK4_LEPPY|nr:putative surface protein amastin [Leptomonas pyrrhocoris]XP_015661527.1 putative surface protein amastin [Leptomonas pyrrhocoris]KPA83087.1 putative surface protein amastin [Leptomonas pyrrhocoris]KPA83088.1 putative surface protein amastin [Leptomonas pyrrhocoris]|eukprot:XP_015661526.1 putative surface protein amastin [Leptomonas pyrrhocoris]